MRNCIFDFDGTLTDSRRDIAGTQLMVLRRIGFETLEERDLYPYIGRTLQETFRALLPPALHDRIEEAAEMYLAEYPSRSLSTTTLFPGVRETLETLRRHGRRLAIASTKKGKGILRATEHFGITPLFDRLQGSDEIPYKPDPAIIHKIVGEMGWTYDETVMIGDTDYDMLAGRNAGIATCGVTYGSCSRPMLVAAGARYVVDSFPEILEIVGISGGAN